MKINVLIDSLLRKVTLNVSNFSNLASHVAYLPITYIQLLVDNAAPARRTALPTLLVDTRLIHAGVLATICSLSIIIMFSTALTKCYYLNFNVWKCFFVEKKWSLEMLNFRPWNRANLFVADQTYQNSKLTRFEICILI